MLKTDTGSVANGKCPQEALLRSGQQLKMTILLRKQQSRTKLPLQNPPFLLKCQDEKDREKEMVWFCNVTSDQQLGDRPGLRAKFYGEPWEQPYERYIGPTRPKKIITSMNKCIEGEVLNREDFPESFAVYDESRFKKMKSLFWAAGFLVVKQDLADIFSLFDMGAGGLVQFPIYRADEKILYPSSYYFLHFGNQKNTFVPEQSQKVFPSYFNKERNLQPWDVYPEADGDVAVTEKA